MQVTNAILALAFSSSLVACGHGTYTKKAPPGEEELFYEHEINDTAATANYLGELHVGQRIVVEGHITQCCSDDFDGFAFYALEPMSIRITLFEFSPHADLDFGIYIPEVGQIVDSWETSNHPEVGIFDFAGSGDFHVVVDSWIGDSAYRLEVEALPFNPHLENQAGMSAAAVERFGGYVTGRTADR